MESQSLLDEMISEDSVQVLKAALPYLPPSGQSFVSVFAKFLELSNTIRLFHTSGSSAMLCAQSNEKNDPLEMLTACSKVCSGPMKERIDNMLNTLVMLQMFDLSQRPVSSDKDSPIKGGPKRYE